MQVFFNQHSPQSSQRTQSRCRHEFNSCRCRHGFNRADAGTISNRASTDWIPDCRQAGVPTKIYLAQIEFVPTIFFLDFSQKRLYN